MSRTCASCLTFSVEKITKSQPDLKPSWLSEKNYVEDFITKTTNFALKIPSKSDTKIDLEMKSMANKKILYWASDSKPHSHILINDAKTAYGNFSNHGIAKCDKNGKVTVKFRAPQVYSTIQKGNRKEQTYFPHLHFVIANSAENGWLSQIYTKIVVPVVKHSELRHMMMNQCHVLINALPAEYYGKDHIPNSYNLFHKQIKKMSVQELRLWFSYVVKHHYPKIWALLSSHKIDIYELPIACYCAHKDCNASELAIEELMKKGFVNVVDYKGGMKEYRSKNPHD